MSILLALAAFLPQDIQETLFKNKKDMLALPGVKSFTICGIDGKDVLVVCVENEDAKKTVTDKYGDSIGGHPIHFIVSKPAEKKPTATTPTTEPQPQDKKPKKPDGPPPTAAGTLRDYTIPYFPAEPAPTTTTTSTNPNDLPLVTEDGVDIMGHIPDKKPGTTTTSPNPDRGPTRSPGSTTGSGPTRPTGTNNPTTGPTRPTGTNNPTSGPTRDTTTSGGTGGPRRTQPTSNNPRPSRHWSPTSGNRITRTVRGVPT